MKPSANRSSPDVCGVGRCRSIVGARRRRFAHARSWAGQDDGGRMHDEAARGATAAERSGDGDANRHARSGRRQRRRARDVPARGDRSRRIGASDRKRRRGARRRPGRSSSTHRHPAARWRGAQATGAPRPCRSVEEGGNVDLVELSFEMLEQQREVENRGVVSERLRWIRAAVEALDEGRDRLDDLLM